MIRTAKTNNPSAHIKRRSATMEVERLSPTRFRVIPVERGKAVRIVEFFLGGGEGAIDCYSELDHSGCPANDRNRMCAHCNAAISLLLEQNGESNVSQ